MDGFLASTIVLHELQRQEQLDRFGTHCEKIRVGKRALGLLNKLIDENDAFVFLAQNGQLPALLQLIETTTGFDTNAIVRKLMLEKSVLRYMATDDREARLITFLAKRSSSRLSETLTSSLSRHGLLAGACRNPAFIQQLIRVHSQSGKIPAGKFASQVRQDASLAQVLVETGQLDELLQILKWDPDPKQTKMKTICNTAGGMIGSLLRIGETSKAIELRSQIGESGDDAMLNEIGMRRAGGQLAEEIAKRVELGFQNKCYGELMLSERYEESLAHYHAHESWISLQLLSYQKRYCEALRTLHWDIKVDEKSTPTGDDERGIEELSLRELGFDELEYIIRTGEVDPDQLDGWIAAVETPPSKRPAHETSRMAIGITCIRAGRPDEFIFKGFYRAVAYLHIGRSLAERGERDDAVKVLQAGLQIAWPTEPLHFQILEALAEASEQPGEQAKWYRLYRAGHTRYRWVYGKHPKMLSIPLRIHSALAAAAAARGDWQTVDVELEKCLAISDGDHDLDET